MEMFNTHRRDILNFDNYMDLKKPGFGGPASAMSLRDGKGKIVNSKPKLAGFQRTVERDPAFSHPVYDPTYKAMTGDLVYRQEGKKPFTYDDRITGIPVVEIEPVEEGRAYSSFYKFINEAIDDEVEDELEDDEDFEGQNDILDYEERAMDRYFSKDRDEDDSFDDEHDYDDPLWSDEEETRTEATRSNNTMSDLRSIEAMLRGFENGEDFDEEEDFGTNPLEDEESPFGEIPDWVKELQAPEDSEGY
jgi:hypothetical protein